MNMRKLIWGGIATGGIATGGYVPNQSSGSQYFSIARPQPIVPSVRQLSNIQKPPVWLEKNSVWKLSQDCAAGLSDVVNSLSALAPTTASSRYASYAYYNCNLSSNQANSVYNLLSNKFQTYGLTPTVNMYSQELSNPDFVTAMANATSNQSFDSVVTSFNLQKTTTSSSSTTSRTGTTTTTTIQSVYNESTQEYKHTVNLNQTGNDPNSSETWNFTTAQPIANWTVDQHGNITGTIDNNLTINASHDPTTGTTTTTTIQSDYNPVKKNYTHEVTVNLNQTGNDPNSSETWNFTTTQPIQNMTVDPNGNINATTPLDNKTFNASYNTTTGTTTTTIYNSTTNTSSTTLSVSNTSSTTNKCLEFNFECEGNLTQDQLVLVQNKCQELVADQNISDTKLNEEACEHLKKILNNGTNITNNVTNVSVTTTTTTYNLENGTVNITFTNSSRCFDIELKCGDNLTKDIIDDIRQECQKLINESPELDADKLHREVCEIVSNSTNATTSNSPETTTTIYNQTTNTLSTTVLKNNSSNITTTTTTTLTTTTVKKQAPAPAPAPAPASTTEQPTEQPTGQPTETTTATTTTVIASPGTCFYKTALATNVIDRISNLNLNNAKKTSANKIISRFANGGNISQENIDNIKNALLEAHEFNNAEKQEISTELDNVLRESASVEIKCPGETTLTLNVNQDGNRRLTDGEQTIEFISSDEIIINVQNGKANVQCGDADITFKGNTYCLLERNGNKTVEGTILTDTEIRVHTLNKQDLNKLKADLLSEREQIRAKLNPTGVMEERGFIDPAEQEILNDAMGELNRVIRGLSEIAGESSTRRLQGRAQGNRTSTQLKGASDLNIEPRGGSASLLALATMFSASALSGQNNRRGAGRERVPTMVANCALTVISGMGDEAGLWISCAIAGEKAENEIELIVATAVAFIVTLAKLGIDCRYPNLAKNHPIKYSLGDFGADSAPLFFAALAMGRYRLLGSSLVANALAAAVSNPVVAEALAAAAAAAAARVVRAGAARVAPAPDGAGGVDVSKIIAIFDRATTSNFALSNLSNEEALTIVSFFGENNDDKLNMLMWHCERYNKRCNKNTLKKLALVTHTDKINVLIEKARNIDQNIKRTPSMTEAFRKIHDRISSLTPAAPPALADGEAAAAAAEGASSSSAAARIYPQTLAPVQLTRKAAGAGAGDVEQPPVDTQPAGSGALPGALPGAVGGAASSSSAAPARAAGALRRSDSPPAEDPPAAEEEAPAAEAASSSSGPAGSGSAEGPPAWPKHPSPPITQETKTLPLPAQPLLPEAPAGGAAGTEAAAAAEPPSEPGSDAAEKAAALPRAVYGAASSSSAPAAATERASSSSGPAALEATAKAAAKAEDVAKIAEELAAAGSAALLSGQADDTLKAVDHAIKAVNDAIKAAYDAIKAAYGAESSSSASEAALGVLNQAVDNAGSLVANARKQMNELNKIAQTARQKKLQRVTLPAIPQQRTPEQLRAAEKARAAAEGGASSSWQLPASSPTSPAAGAAELEAATAAAEKKAAELEEAAAAGASGAEAAEKKVAKAAAIAAIAEAKAAAARAAAAEAELAAAEGGAKVGEEEVKKVREVLKKANRKGTLQPPTGLSRTISTPLLESFGEKLLDTVTFGLRKAKSDTKPFKSVFPGN